MATAPTAGALNPETARTLESIARRVLWLAVRMVDYANHERPNLDGIKVGGHQASSASMVGILTSLWFTHLRADDFVSVKPHASPAFHAIQYLIGTLDRSYLTRLRERGGLQAYPSRTKDPDIVHFSTGSMGLGAAAPLFAAAVRRYVDAHFGERPPGRFISLIGDAELDEGNVWEAIVDPVTQGLGNALWVVDLNRQSLDRVVPGIKARQLKSMFSENGWHVIDAKYGRHMKEAFARPGGDGLRRHVDDMSNEQYQSLFKLRGRDLRDRFTMGADRALVRFVDEFSDVALPVVIQNLGGHDLVELHRAYAEADDVRDKPTVIFAYTIKGWGLPIAGDPLNHAALLNASQIEAFRSELGLTSETEWEPFAEDSVEGSLCREVRSRLCRAAVTTTAPVKGFSVPVSLGVPQPSSTSTQETFGRLMAALAKEEIGRRVVTTSPDVSVSTNLGGWINRVGVFAPTNQPDYSVGEQLLKWQPSQTGQHLELGISEMNLFLLLGQLGLASEFSGEQLFPVGTLYDPFVCRGLDAFLYSVYSGARFIVAGTPSGVTLGPEGGAHQSTITASIGLELPGVTFAEPAFARALEWLFCRGLAALCEPDGEALYLRLSTRPIDQAPFDAVLERLGEPELRRQVLLGGYKLFDASGVEGPIVHLFAAGAVVPEAMEAAAQLGDEGVAAHVIDVTSLDRLYRDWRSAQQRAVRSARIMTDDFHLAQLIPIDERNAPIVTIHDASTHAMAWIGSVFGATVVPVGVDSFGQSGSIGDLYALNDLNADAIVNAALAAMG